MPKITYRKYHPESGALLNNFSTSSFGKIKPGTHSGVQVFDIAFSEVSSVSNIKIGLISNANLPVNPNPDSQSSDGTTSNGHFGIENTSTFDSSKCSSPLLRHFAGLNTTILSSDPNNVSIEKRSEFVSNFIYIDVELSSNNAKDGNIAYKVFFDYS